MNCYLLLQDSVEILFYSSIIYSFCIWLKQDRTKNILGYFLAYCSMVILAWAIDLPTVTPFLFSYTPIVLIIFILTHEKRLQKNLVALRTITPKQPVPEDWLDSLLSCALTAINNNKAITIVIEHKDSLEHFLSVPFLMDAYIGKGILDILLASTSYDQNKLVWVNTHGNIRGINGQWHASDVSSELPIEKMCYNKADALFYSLQCDAIIVYINQYSRSFTIITRGTETKNISVQEIKNKIRKELIPSNKQYRQGDIRENNSTETSSSQ